MTNYSGLYRGIVVDNNDSAKAGRVKVIVPTISVEPLVNWAVPRNSYMLGASQGVIVIPEEGTKVWVEFENGNINYPVFSLASWLGHENYNGLEDVETGKVYSDKPKAKVFMRTKNMSFCVDEEVGNIELIRQDIDETSSWWQKVKRYVSVVLNKGFIEIKKYDEQESKNPTDEEPTVLGKISLTNSSFSIEMAQSDGKLYGKVEILPSGIEISYLNSGTVVAKTLINEEGVKMSTNSDIALEASGNVSIEAEGKVDISSPNVNLVGTTKINGAGTGMPGFCSLPNCAFTGAAHTVDTVGNP